MKNPIVGIASSAPVSPDANCPECKGTGWLDYAERETARRDSDGKRIFDGAGRPVYEVVESHRLAPNTSRMYIVENYPGCVLVARQCECVEAQLREQRLARLGKSEMPDGITAYTFADFSDYPNAVYWAEKIAAGEALIDADGNEKFGLLLLGPLGTGKTTLGSLAYLKRQETVKNAVWTRGVNFMTRCTNTFTPDYTGPSLQDILKDLMYAPLLMVDEFGNLKELEKGTEASRFRNECWLTVFDYRWAHRLPTIITSNLNVDQLYSYFDPAIISRIRGLCFAEVMDGNDKRTNEEQRL